MQINLIPGWNAKNPRALHHRGWVTRLAEPPQGSASQAVDDEFEADHGKFV